MADLADTAGRLVAGPVAALTRVRGAKPMHPRGVLFAGVLSRTGLTGGIPWLEGTGRDDVLVRISRGAGLPPALPDLLGLAVRVPGERPVDLLLSSTGRGPWSRRVPVLRRDAATTYGSIMAYRSPAGPVWLSADPTGGPLPAAGDRLAAAAPGRVVTLSAAVGRGPWEPFGSVTLGEPSTPPDPELPFDAVRHAPPGLVADGPLARFRRPAYAAARAARGVALETGPR